MGKWLSVSAFLAILTLIVSLYVQYAVVGSFFGTVRMGQLERYGGTTFDHIRDFELWRIPVAQLIHAKMLHALYNAACLYVLGRSLEFRLGGLKLLLIWLIAGGIATVVSPILIAPPYDIGTGASQATFAFAGCAAVLAVWTGGRERLWLLLGIALILVPGLILDAAFAGYPKPGHIAGFFLGATFGLAYRGRWKSYGGGVRDHNASTLTDEERKAISTAAASGMRRTFLTRAGRPD